VLFPFDYVCVGAVGVDLEVVLGYAASLQMRRQSKLALLLDGFLNSGKLAAAWKCESRNFREMLRGTLRIQLVG
jgi:hypothetical protein